MRDRIVVRRAKLAGGYDKAVADVLLTRAEVEDAMRRLNEPELTPGDIVVHTDPIDGRKKSLLVIGGWISDSVQQRLDRDYPVGARATVPSSKEVRLTDGAATYVFDATELTLTYSLSKLKEVV